MKIKNIPWQLTKIYIYILFSKKIKLVKIKTEVIVN